MQIEVRHLEKSYGQKVLFKDFSYKFDSGQIYAITGDSGTGKTTLLNMIGLLEKPDDGDIVINGNDKWKIKAIRQYYKNDVSFLFQNYALIEDESVEYNLKLIGKNKEKIDEVLEMLQIGDLKSQKVYTLSGGQQQRVALARALLHDTPILLCDEPTGNLDEHNRNHIFSLLKNWMNKDKTIIMVTHDLELASLCDQKLDLNKLQ